MAKSNPIKRIFDLYTSDLSFEEIEKTIKRDSTEVYEFFKNDIPKESKTRNKFIRALIFTRSLFNAFILRLSPARRIFYLAAVLIFFLGFFQEQNSYIVFGFIILNLLLAFELADKLVTKNEIDVAQKIQSDLMPKTPPEIKNYDLSAHYEAAKEVGGDYYDIIASPGNGDNSYLIIGDISGKGIPAAIYMVRVQAIIHTLINKYSSIKEIVVNLKNTFAKNLLPEYFLTLSAASIDKEGTISICRAGHMPVLHYKAAYSTFEEIYSKGLAIGLKDNGKFEELLEVKDIKPASGDILLFYTDGLTEMMNASKRQFGLDEVKRVISSHCSLSSDEIKDKLTSTLETFRAGYPKHDDFTMILLKAK